jgi:hypothetical protein
MTRANRKVMRSSCAALASWWIASTALAHPSPAEAPEFFPADCIIVVDKQQHASWHLDYAVLADDTEQEVDHVSLADSKTHQFFALAGTLLPRANDHVFLPFDDEAGILKVMPTWLTRDDVMRTAAGVAPEDMTAFTAAEVSTQNVLESDPALASRVRPLVAGTARVPITEAQALAGVEWDLTDVPPGVYQIAAYVFSPPYNGWAVREGLIKVVDGADEESAPAVTLNRVAARLFAGQGRRVRGCVDAPVGSTLELSTRVQSALPGVFELHATQAVTTGEFEVCLANEGRDDVLEVRVEVRTPAAVVAATQSSDVLSLFSNAAACVPSELTCCPEGSSDDAGIAARDAELPMVPAEVDPAVDAAQPSETVDPQHDAAAQPVQPVSESNVATTQHGGCAVADHPVRRQFESTASLALVVLALLRWIYWAAGCTGGTRRSGA